MATRWRKGRCGRSDQGCAGKAKEEGGVSELGKPLTPQEVAALPDGTEVMVRWTGGNGPHGYKIRREGNLVCTDNLYRDELRFVGPSQPHTEVWLGWTDHARGLRSAREV